MASSKGIHRIPKNQKANQGEVIAMRHASADSWWRVRDFVVWWAFGEDHWETLRTGQNLVDMGVERILRPPKGGQTDRWAEGVESSYVSWSSVSKTRTW